MKRIQIEHMRPQEIIDAKEDKSIIYLSFGPVEWHNPANPYGTDAFIAQDLACKAAEKTGGVVFPLCYMGSDSPRSSDQLEKLGFKNTDQHIIGMDFPNNLLKSFYFPVEVVSIVIKEHIKLCIEHGYKLIVILSTHGADTQNILISETCKEYTNNSASTVLNGFSTLFQGIGKNPKFASVFGHANVSETSIMCHLRGDDVDLKELPCDRNTKLRYQDYGILDSSVFASDEKSDGYVINDPRDSTTELGKSLFDFMLDGVISNVTGIYEKIDTEQGA